MDVWYEIKGCQEMVQYSDIADLRQKHKLFVVMCDSAGENKFHEIVEFLESLASGVKNYFSTSTEH